jgi:hypothetical protein
VLEQAGHFIQDDSPDDIVKAIRAVYPAGTLDEVQAITQLSLDDAALR